ncbi:Endonuclease OS=Streptomyces violarus OX=67380 GN=FHS41_001735 PE=4 SV=1 [Streptomyces violarus]
MLCENVRIAQEALPVPLAVENIAALFSWPGEEMTEGQFLYELADRTGVRLLIDVANLHTNHVNRAEDPAKALAELPLEAIAYVHVAGGFERDGVWHDSHAYPVPRPVLDVLTDLASRVSPPGVLLERDENFPEPAELEAELASIRRAVEAGAVERVKAEVRAAGHAVAAGRPEAAAGGWSEVRADVPARGYGATPQGHQTGAAGATRGASGRPEHTGVDEARQRLGLAQAALLSALVAGTPVPEGFDRARVGVQARALAAKRADVVAKVAPELPEILGVDYRTAFLAYAQTQPMTGGYRRDALTFAERLLSAGGPGTSRRAGNSGSGGWTGRDRRRDRDARARRLARATRKVLLRR